MQALKKQREADAHIHAREMKEKAKQQQKHLAQMRAEHAEQQQNASSTNSMLEKINDERATRERRVGGGGGVARGGGTAASPLGLIQTRVHRPATASSPSSGEGSSSTTDNRPSASAGQSKPKAAPSASASALAAGGLELSATATAPGASAAAKAGKRPASAAASVPMTASASFATAAAAFGSANLFPAEPKQQSLFPSDSSMGGGSSVDAAAGEVAAEAAEAHAMPKSEGTGDVPGANKARRSRLSSQSGGSYGRVRPSPGRVNRTETSSDSPKAAEEEAAGAPAASPPRTPPKWAEELAVPASPSATYSMRSWGSSHRFPLSASGSPGQDVWEEEEVELEVGREDDENEPDSGTPI